MVPVISKISETSTLFCACAVLPVETCPAIFQQCHAKNSGVSRKEIFLVGKYAHYVAKQWHHHPPVTHPTEWCAPIVVAPKKDSDSIRLCVDLSHLNRYVRRERYQSTTPAQAVAENPRLQRLKTKIMGYSFTAEWIKG